MAEMEERLKRLETALGLDRFGWDEEALAEFLNDLEGRLEKIENRLDDLAEHAGLRDPNPPV